MFFYIFLQPEIFSEAASHGEDATQNLASILSGFLQNCFLAVFEDDRWAPSVKETLMEWPETLTRRRIMSLLVQFKKRKRFLYCITPDYTEEKSDLDCVFGQVASIPLDLVLVIDSERNRLTPVGVEITTRRAYQNTVFEPNRSAIAIYGKTCTPGDMDELDFLNFHFAKAFKYASEIHICDRICGSFNLSDNFRYTIKYLISWLGNILNDPATCKIVFHLGQPKGFGTDHILQELSSFKKTALPHTEIELHIYNESPATPSLPHQRFIITDQIALNIDRGLDFLDRNTHKCRDTYINCQDPEEAQRLLNGYTLGRLSIHAVR
jgi:hypothetical protein